MSTKDFGRAFDIVMYIFKKPNHDFLINMKTKAILLPLYYAPLIVIMQNLNFSKIL